LTFSKIPDSCQIPTFPGFPDKWSPWMWLNFSKFLTVFNAFKRCKCFSIIYYLLLGLLLMLSFISVSMSLVCLSYCSH